MTSRHLKYALLSLALIAALPAAATFRDPLETPAQMNLELARSSRLTAVTRAGDRLVAVGPRGHILVSDDQGANWKQAEVPVSVDLVAVRFVTPRQGWVVGHDGVVLHSTDGGSTWTKRLDGQQAIRIMKDYFVQRADMGHEDARNLLSEVARYEEEGPTKPFLDVLFLNEQEGFIVGAFGQAFHTGDGGKSWKPLLGRIDNPRSLHIYALAQSGGRVYAAGEQGMLLKWDGERERFDAMASPYRGSFFGLLGTDAGLVAYGLRGNAFASRDGGASWSELKTGVTDAITGAAGLGGEAVVLATQGGKLLVDRGQGELQELPVTRPMAYFSLANAGPRSLVVVGSGGVQVESISIQK
ncbi:WD40/YVTN/BNR-like repeat-containing protein [Aromatoleum petrolei]|uniref:Glycosyl hydrolase n=1 Tax=Aromatoleum petrolei TaxID=76116 RepID=A0ABX1MTR0_9RHOO|nr:YCF48-related protein [Aromatoleum petrolei]NMF89715.1 glycosyl hydrolase [Aromatoleum petrolei]QTQ37356.1 Ycf48/Hcf136-like domain-containing protein [Aromatoleum petrolei]